MKLCLLRENAFAFFRGTAHLFYATAPSHAILRDAPAVHICGDLHVQNFGTYKADNRLTYFDINDFDEAALAPFTFDLLRFLTSVHLAASAFGWSRGLEAIICEKFMHDYQHAISAGKARWVERATSIGVVRNLLRSLKSRQRVNLLNERAPIKRKRRVLLVDGKRAIKAGKDDIFRVHTILDLLAEHEQDKPMFHVLDVAHRIAGNASLGLERFVLLTEGRGSPNENFLLDLKQSIASSLVPYANMVQPRWQCESSRIAGTQQLVQACPPALLRPLVYGGRSYLLKELQPSADRLDLKKCGKDRNDLVCAFETMAKVTAWAHLRGAGRWGAADIDTLQAFCADRAWTKAMVKLSKRTAALVVSQWRNYSADYDRT
jgi:uncharacterized protein (DUF2252 family)